MELIGARGAGDRGFGMIMINGCTSAAVARVAGSIFWDGVDPGAYAPGFTLPSASRTQPVVVARSAGG